MPDNVDNETLLIKVKAEDEASDVLKKIKDNLDKLPNDTEKLKYLTSQISSFARQAKNASPATKTLIKDINKVLGVGKGFKVKSLSDTIRNLYTFKSEITTDYKTDLQKQTRPKPKILQGIKGNIVSTDTVKGIIKTEDINAQGQKIVRTYHDISNASGQWQGVLKSEITYYKTQNTQLTKMQKVLGFLKSAGKGVFKTLKNIFGRLGRIFTSIIAFRLASSFITLFINAFKKGFEAIKKSSDNLVDNFQEFNYATTQISISLATSFIPLIQSLATVLTPLSEKLLNVANYMSATNAVAKGQSQYFELDAQKIREYSKSLEEANKQLTQLDKFATLTSKSSYSLGTWKDIEDFDFDNVDKDTKETAKAIENLSNVIKTLVDWLLILEIDGIASIILLVATIGSLTNPIGLVFSSLGALILLFTSSKPIVQALSAVVLGLAGAFIALGIAKAFFKNPYNGLIVAGWGAVIGVGIGAIVSSIGNIARQQGNNNPNYNSSNSLNSGGQALNESMNSAMSNNANSYQVTGGDVYLDSTKVGRVLAPEIQVSGSKKGYW